MAKELESVIVVSKVKDIVKDADMQSSGDFTDALNAKVHELVDAAVERCKANGRKTVRPEDL